MLDTLGTLIGFVTVVLLLSIASTSLVQMTSAAARLRGRNLFRGLSCVLRSAGATCGVDEKSMNAKALAERVLSSPRLLEIGRSVLPAKMPRWLRGPSRTWISKDELKKILADLPELEGTAIVPDRQSFMDEVDALFSRFEDLTEKRFGFFMRMVTIFWAAVIAIAFQVSAPQLLRSLSGDAELRKSAITAMSADLPQLAPVALDELGKKHAGLDQILEGVKSKAPGERLAELQTAVKDLPDGAAIVEDYVDLLGELYEQRIDDSMGNLARLKIGLWGRGDDFYWTRGGSGLDLQWNNILGVALMAILLSLGAPFWFNVLQRMSGLRDALEPDAKGKNDGKNGGGARA